MERVDVLTADQFEGDLPPLRHFHPHALLAARLADGGDGDLAAEGEAADSASAQGDDLVGGGVGADVEEPAVLDSPRSSDPAQLASRRAAPITGTPAPSYVGALPARASRTSASSPRQTQTRETSSRRAFRAASGVIHPRPAASAPMMRRCRPVFRPSARGSARATAAPDGRPSAGVS